jgi:cellulose biosynthesis protein BcsQ
MAIVAIISRKGGSGKSTLASNIAAYFAKRQTPVTLGDLDHQQSMRVWLARRPASAPAIASWTGDTNALLRPPAGIANLVLDTPGGLHGFALSKVVMIADAVLLPVSGSVFDRESVGECWGELRAHPRVKSGRCQVACIGMRLDGRTNAEELTRDWAASIGLEWLGSLRSAQVYVRAVENGLSIFDLPGKVSDVDREQWIGLLTWLKTQFAKPELADQAEKAEKAGTPQKAPLRFALEPRALQPALQPRSGAYQPAEALRTPVTVKTPVLEVPKEIPAFIAHASTTALPKPLPASSKGLTGAVFGLWGKLRYR